MPTGSTKKSFKKGAASIYIVIFTTLILSVVGGGFIRIVLRDTLDASQVDATQAARDAAEIGLEYAKMAINRYQKCLNEGDSLGLEANKRCAYIVDLMEDPESPNDCTLVAKVLDLSISEDGEIPVKTEDITINYDEFDSLDQAVRCVQLDTQQDDYRNQLTWDFQSKIFPIRTGDLDDVNYIEVRWFNPDKNAGGNPANGNNKSGNLASSKADRSPTALSVQIIQTDPSFGIEDFYLNRGNNTDVASVLLVPSTTAANINAADFALTNDKAIDDIVEANCTPNMAAEFQCSAIIALPKPINGGKRNPGASFIRVAIPYGGPTTDFSITLCKTAPGPGGCNTDNIAKTLFQSRVISIGRAGDTAYRRETRVEYIDVQAPMPQYALNIEEDIVKNFWVTLNNWGGDDYGEVRGGLIGGAPVGECPLLGFKALWCNTFGY